MKKRHILSLVLILFCFPMTIEAKVETLVLAGPRSCVTHPLIYMKEAGLLDAVAEEVKLIIWSNPDQLRSLIAGGQVDFSAVPSHVAANFYNKGIKLKLMNISTWGLLWLISSDPEVKQLSDLKGETLSLTFKQDIPDLVFSRLAQARGIDPKRDVHLKYLPNFKAVGQALLSGRTKHALLPEPLASIAVIKSSRGNFPRLYRALDIQEEWGAVHQTTQGMPEAGICAMPRILNQPKVVAAFQKAYQTAISFCSNHPVKAARIVASYLKKPSPLPIASALKNARLEFVSAPDARPELEHFYGIIMKMNPDKTGGKLPADGFYWENR